jgi:hypothetical protein
LHAPKSASDSAG